MRSFASVFWTAAIALFSLLSAALAGIWLFVALDTGPHPPSPGILGGVILHLAAATYGAVEVVRRFRGREPRSYLPLGTLFVVVMLLTGHTLVVNFLRARHRSAATRILDDLRLIDPSIGTEYRTDAYWTRQKPETPSAIYADEAFITLEVPRHLCVDQWFLPGIEFPELEESAWPMSGKPVTHAAFQTAN